MAVRVSDFHTVEVIVEHDGKNHRILFRYDPYKDKDGKKASVSMDEGNTWRDVAVLHQAMGAFAQRCPFAFEEDGANGTAPAATTPEGDFKF